jgi:hypothetical protein
MGTVSGPGVSWWESFDTFLDPSSSLFFSGTGFTLTNPLRFVGGFSDWTMTNNTNLVAGSGISKYVQQTSKQQFSQRIEQTGSEGSDRYTFIFFYKVAQTGTDSTIIQWNSNNLTFSHNAAGQITMRHQNVDFSTTGLGMTDNRWRHYVFTRSGTAATMFVNGSLFTTFTGLSALGNNAVDTKVFDFPGCDGQIGQIWFNMGQTITAAQVTEHFRAFRGRFGLR